MERILPNPTRWWRAGHWHLIRGAALLGALAAAAAAPAADRAGPGPQTYEAVNAAPTFRPMSEIRADIRLNEGVLPLDRSEAVFHDAEMASQQALERGLWPDLGFWWAPTEFFHQPLYFDDVLLERYGHTRCRLAQPALSGGHFFGSLALLPYKLLVDHPCRPVSQLGYYRPGSCAPPQREGLRLEIDPAWFHRGVCLWRCSACAAH